MIEAGLTRSGRATKVGIESDPGELRVFVPSCESVFPDVNGAQSSDCGWVDQVVWTPATNLPSSSLATALDTSLSILTGGHVDWSSTTLQPYHGSECGQSGYPAYNQFSEMQTRVSGSGTLIFYWKISAKANFDYLRFYVDGVLQGNPITGATSWAQKSVTITGDGNHTLVWRYTRGSETVEHDNRGYVDYLQWSGAGPIEEEEDEPEWQTVSYTYDPAGRRIEKKVDGTTEVKYVYDGDNILAEYNNAGTLLRKYVHGEGIDEPICMIEASGTYAGTHYYHYDALGSVVAMTNSSGNVVELYEYSVYGQVAASDANHPNRFMFTGREFDKDTGLYYYRARYYNPEVGRFLQTDPIGYGDGMNWYGYCTNNPLRYADPLGLERTPYGYLWCGDTLYYLENDLEYNTYWSNSGLCYWLNISRGGLVLEGYADGLPVWRAEPTSSSNYWYWADFEGEYPAVGIMSPCDSVPDSVVIDWGTTAGVPIETSGGQKAAGMGVAGILGGILAGAADGPSPIVDILYWGSAIGTGALAAYSTGDMIEYGSQVQKCNAAIRCLKDLQREYNNAKGPKRKRPIREAMEELLKDIEGHIKQMRKRWPNLPRPDVPIVKFR